MVLATHRQQEMQIVVAQVAEGRATEAVGPALRQSPFHTCRVIRGMRDRQADIECHDGLEYLGKAIDIIPNRPHRVALLGIARNRGIDNQPCVQCLFECLLKARIVFSLVAAARLDEHVPWVTGGDG